MLVPVVEKSEIAQCQAMFMARLEGCLKNKREITVGHPGDSFNVTASCNDQLWFYSTLLDDIDRPRYWNIFGLEIQEGRSQNIVVEINPPLEGYVRITAGLFAKDTRGEEYYLLHRGRVGGGKKGVGKEAFVGWYRGSMVDVIAPDDEVDQLILVGRLSSAGFCDQVIRFVREVAKFKEEIASGDLKRQYKDKNFDKNYKPEFWGKKTINISRSMEYECLHGKIVDELEAYVRSQENGNVNIFNTRYIDLGVEKNDKVIKIYEVKSSADSQSVYTAIGQLLFHSTEPPNIEKILVLPKGQLKEEARNVVGKLGLKIIEYTISKNGVNFRK